MAESPLHSELLRSPGQTRSHREDDLTQRQVSAHVPWSQYREMIDYDLCVTPFNGTHSKGHPRRMAKRDFPKLRDAHVRAIGPPNEGSHQIHRPQEAGHSCHFEVGRQWQSKPLRKNRVVFGRAGDTALADRRPPTAPA